MQSLHDPGNSWLPMPFQVSPHVARAGVKYESFIKAMSCSKELWFVLPETDGPERPSAVCGRL
jgi:hypothetical protein